MFGEPVTVVPGTPTLERWRSVQLIWFRAVRFTARLDHHPGDQGYLLAHGDQGSGYGLYVLGDEVMILAGLAAMMLTLARMQFGEAREPNGRQGGEAREPNGR